jgi:hypothetical protein
LPIGPSRLQEYLIPLAPSGLSVRQNDVSALTDLSQLKLISRGLASCVVSRLSKRPATNPSDALIVAGYPRSGTTWLAELIATVPGTGVIFEPLSIEHVREARAAGLDWQNFHLPSEDWPAGRHFFERVLAAKVLTPWTASAMNLRQAARARRWVIKMVRANQMLGWIAQNFATKPAALIIRHPCAVLASRESRGWPSPTFPPSNPGFFGAFPHLEGYVKSLRHPEEHFSTRWCMNYYAPLNLVGPRPFIELFYETLLMDPENQLRRLLNAWEMTLSEDAWALATRPSSKASTEMSRSGADLGRWRTKLGATRIARILAVLREFGLEFYGDSPLPDQSRIAASTAHSVAVDNVN